MLAGAGTTIAALTVRLLHRLVRSLALLLRELTVLVGVELLDESLALLRGETGTGAAGLLLLTGRGPAGGFFLAVSAYSAPCNFFRENFE